MKPIILLFTVTLIFSTGAFAAKMVNSEQDAKSAGYQSLGGISVSQDGTTTVGHKALSEAADKKCEESGGTKAGHCYYRVIGDSGHKSNHKDINLEVYKK